MNLNLVNFNSLKFSICVSCKQSCLSGLIWISSHHYTYHFDKMLSDSCPLQVSRDRGVQLKMGLVWCSSHQSISQSWAGKLRWDGQPGPDLPAVSGGQWGLHIRGKEYYFAFLKLRIQDKIVRQYIIWGISKHFGFIHLSLNSSHVTLGWWVTKSKLPVNRDNGTNFVTR
jgi:hypothetical protein